MFYGNSNNFDQEIYRLGIASILCIALGGDQQKYLQSVLVVYTTSLLLSLPETAVQILQIRAYKNTQTLAICNPSHPTV